MLRIERDGIAGYVFETLAAVGLPHIITGRQGGVSTGPYASLNVSRGVGDDDGAVRENVRRLFVAAGIEPGSVVTANQKHTANVARVGAEDGGQSLPNTDVLITGAPGVTLMMRYADCTPLVLFDPVRKALAVVHSGWRGTVQGAAAAAVAALAREYGSEPEEIVAAIGPSVGPCCYEVGPEVEEAAANAFGDTADILRRNASVRPHFDLWSANRRWLVNAGVRRIETAEICTVCHHEEFFSYRSGRGKTGHFAAIAGLPAEDGPGWSWS